MEVTIKHVATVTGVSIRTVSRVLNKSPKVNQDTRAKVEAAIERLGFRPSLRARGLAKGRSFLIGMVHNDRNALVLDAVQRGIVREASARGYELVVHPTPVDEAEAVADVLTFARRSRVDGLVVLAPLSGAAGIAAAIREARVKAVALSAVPLDGFGTVLIAEERRAAADAVRHLIGLGHRRIAMISGLAGVHSASERRAGYSEALAEAGLESAGIVEGDYAFDSGFAGAEALLDRAEPPTAIFAANDAMAAGVLKAAAARGLSVPGQLSVVGFDGGILARMLSPALTTIHRPIGEMAELATCHLLDMLDGEAGRSPAPITLSLRVGESSGPVPA